MRQLLYVSSTKRDLPDAMLESILSASRKNNEPAGITGMVMYLEGGFLQVLEGEADQVEAPISASELTSGIGMPNTFGPRSVAGILQLDDGLPANTSLR